MTLQIKTVVPEDLLATNNPVNGYNLIYDSETKKFIWLSSGDSGSKIITIDDSYEVKINDGIILARDLVSNISVYLPDSMDCDKKMFTIINETSYDVTLVAQGDDVFYTGLAYFILDTLGQSIEIMANHGWVILKGFKP